MANYIKDTAIQENSISETKLDSALQSWKETVTNHINNNDNPHNITKSSIGLDNVTNDAQVKRSELGVANGVATLDSTGKVPSGQLPSYVDDVIEGYLYNGVFYKDTSYTTSIVGESGKIYIDLPTNKTYRWTGSVYGVISETIALGETSSTAYRGDRGKIAYDHSQSAHAPSNAQANVIETIKVNGTALTPNSKAVDITVPTVGNGTITIKQGGTSKGTFTTNQNGNTTIELTDTNTTYTAGDGLSLSGTTFSNNGVRSIATGTTNGTISVNTNGNISNIGVYGLKSAAYTDSSDYAAASHTHSQYLTSALIPAKLAREETYPPGYFIIKINNNNSEWMLSFDVKIVVRDGSYTIRFSEDNSTKSESWSSPSASMIDGENSIEVKFGYSQTNKWVAIPSPDLLVGISITNVANGYAPIDTYALDKLFSINFYGGDNLQYLGTVQKTITIYPPSKEGHTHTFTSLTSKPTTISGYGITDAYTATTIDSKLSSYLPLSGGTLSGRILVQGDFTFTDSTYGQAPFSIINNNSSAYAPSFDATFPNQGTTRWNSVVSAGVSNSLNNKATINFGYRGDGSTLNFLGLGFWSNDNILSVVASGNVGIGITNPSYKLHVVGDGYFTENVITESDFSSRGNAVIDGIVSCTKLLQTSDIKYKTNIKQIKYEEALKIIENLNPVTWDWNENTKISGSSSGFIAQEVKDIIPNAVSEGDENTLSLDYTQLHSYEIKVIQEQQKEIKDLKQRLEVLESLVLQLTNREI